MKTVDGNKKHFIWVDWAENDEDDEDEVLSSPKPLYPTNSKLAFSKINIYLIIFRINILFCLLSFDEITILVVQN